MSFYSTILRSQLRFKGSGGDLKQTQLLTCEQEYLCLVVQAISEAYSTELPTPETLNSETLLSS